MKTDHRSEFGVTLSVRLLNFCAAKSKSFASDTATAARGARRPTAIFTLFRDSFERLPTHPNCLCHRLFLRGRLRSTIALAGNQGDMLSTTLSSLSPSFTAQTDYDRGA